MYNKIICGFAGIGKSTFARNNKGVVDLESTPFDKDWKRFDKDWKRYVKVAKHMADNGYIVLLSCHKELREELQNSGIKYSLALPHKEAKDEYIKRYRERGNDAKFIQNMIDKWDEFLNIMPDEGDLIIIEDYLRDIFITNH